MTDSVDIRESSDVDALVALYPAAFPEEDLMGLVRLLLTETPGVLSLAAFAGAQAVGHVVFTPCWTEGSAKGALLGPLAVVPAAQRQGVGTALIAKGFEALGMAQVFVLGDPAYYGRFGFAAERAVLPPYPLPKEYAEAWQSRLPEQGAPLAEGALTLPKAWMAPEYWM